MAAVPRTPTTRRSMATGYLSVSEAYEEGEGLAGSVVVLVETGSGQGRNR